MIIAPHQRGNVKALEALIREAKGEPIVLCGWNHELLSNDMKEHIDVVLAMDRDREYRALKDKEIAKLSLHEYALSDIFVDSNKSEPKKSADLYIRHCIEAAQSWLFSTRRLKEIATEKNAQVYLVPGPMDISQEKLGGITEYVLSKQARQRRKRHILSEFLNTLTLCKDEPLFDDKNLIYLHLKNVNVQGITIKGVGGVVSAVSDYKHFPMIYQEDTLAYMAMPADNPETIIEIMKEPADITLLPQKRPDTLTGLPDNEMHLWRLVNDFMNTDVCYEMEGAPFEFFTKNPTYFMRIPDRGSPPELMRLSEDYARTVPPEVEIVQGLVTPITGSQIYIPPGQTIAVTPKAAPADKLGLPDDIDELMRAFGVDPDKVQTTPKHKEETKLRMPGDEQGSDLLDLEVVVGDTAIRSAAKKTSPITKNYKTALERSDKGYKLLMQRKIDEGLTLYEQALDLAPTGSEIMRSVILYNIGLAYAENDRFKDAQKVLDESYKLKKDKDTKKALDNAKKLVA